MEQYRQEQREKLHEYQKGLSTRQQDLIKKAQEEQREIEKKEF